MAPIRTLTIATLQLGGLTLTRIFETHGHRHVYLCVPFLMCDDAPQLTCTQNSWSPESQEKEHICVERVVIKQGLLAWRSFTHRRNILSSKVGLLMAVLVLCATAISIVLRLAATYEQPIFRLIADLGIPGLNSGESFMMPKQLAWMQAKNIRRSFRLSRCFGRYYVTDWQED